MDVFVRAYRDVFTAFAEKNLRREPVHRAPLTSPPFGSSPIQTRHDDPEHRRYCRERREHVQTRRVISCETLRPAYEIRPDETAQIAERIDECDAGRSS